MLAGQVQGLFFVLDVSGCLRFFDEAQQPADLWAGFEIEGGD